MMNFKFIVDKSISVCSELTIVVGRRQLKKLEMVHFRSP